MSECCKGYGDALRILREIRRELQGERVVLLDRVMLLVADHYTQHVQESGEAL